VRLAVSHLASLGHRRIGLITGPSRYTPVQRKVDAFRSVVRELDHADADDRLIAESVFTVEGGHAAARRVLDAGATAIVAASDLMALGAVRAARDSGRSVPGEVSVVGYDDTALMAYTDPPLTTVRQPVRAIADHATRVLLDLIGGLPSPRHEYVVRPELVVRASTGPCPLHASA
jgi:alanine racemase